MKDFLIITLNGLLCLLSLSTASVFTQGQQGTLFIAYVVVAFVLLSKIKSPLNKEA